MTWSYFFPKFDAIKGVAIDYMHCILLGVMKMLMMLWFDSAYKMMPWYIGSNIKAIDDKVQNFKLPNIITRLPRSIKGDLSHWNTSELCCFLLFYSVSVLWNVLPHEYFCHFI